jgi:glutamate-1-semialdehyde 2,1-aminomutase
MLNQHSNSEFNHAKSLLVGGVNSPVRAFKGVGGTPLFFESGSGSTLTSVDNQAYTDYVLSWGPLILGHAHPRVTTAIHHALDQGTSFGAPTPKETVLAEQVQFFYPSMEKIRFVNSGTEAGMSVIRLARGFTKKSKIIKFSGCYHGHADALLVAAGSGGLTLGIPDSEGVTAGATQDTISLEYNDTDSVNTVFREYKDTIAAIILEPIAGNMGVIRPQENFLKAIQQGCRNTGALLIFDEVMCGFRVHPKGAQGLLGITPDLTMLGKVIGGGLPCGAYGGRAEIMDCVAPEGPVYQAGTLSGNPVVMAAGIETLSILKEDNVIEIVSQSTAEFINELREILPSNEICMTQVGSLFSLFFTDQIPQSLKDVQQTNIKKFTPFHRNLLENGVYFPPSAYESCFTSIMHSSEDYKKTIQAIQQSI